MPESRDALRTHAGNGWDEYKRLVINELERANKRLDMVDKRLSKIERNLTVLQTKAYVASAIIAVVFSGLVTFVFQLQ